MLSKTITSKARGRKSKLSKNLERLFREGKCRECSVVVTRMDFAKILGKFTKVKIQFESSSTLKGKSAHQNLKSKLKRNENGYICDDDYSSRESSKRRKLNDSIHSKAENNILKDNNILKKPLKDRNSNYNRKTNNLKIKQYHVVFSSPKNTDKTDIKPNISLTKLIPKIDETLLPTDEWSIDYNPKPVAEEPADDKVYDRIAAELEDLMNNGKTTLKTENKSDEFPSIMDILNDTPVDSKSENKNETVEVRSNLESSDVEAILLGEPTSVKEDTETTDIKVEENDVSNLIADVAQLDTLQPSETPNTVQDNDNSDILNPHSPSILDEALQKGIEEHLPPEPQNKIQTENQVTEVLEKSTDQKEIDCKSEISSQSSLNDIKKEDEAKEDSSTSSKSEGTPISNKLFANADNVTEIIFKKNINGECYKSVTCQKDLMYFIQINGKAVQLVGAPKFITTLDDLQILLQIVHESDLESFHVLQ